MKQIPLLRGAALVPPSSMARAIRTFPRLFLGASHLSSGFGTGSPKPSASQFHADDDKALALGSSGQPCSGHVKTLLCQALVAPLSLASLVQSQWSGSWQGSCWARGEWEILPHCPAENRRVKSAPAPKLYRLFLTLCDPSGVTLTCRASQTCSTLSVSLMNLTQSWKADRERVGREGDTTLPSPRTTLSIL